ncbi:hypothetical protein YSA_09869 [Pseudomonas putida ND6]|uniref:Uncharacterized protein n=1 Tax=Pseudomonas putida ND6 TaxID=231023 RepID=I3V309_PSEPU|nr:hypothetical protein YSA_09869 [Pseudomonas putida ND6]
MQAPTGLKGFRLQIDGEGTVGVEGDISVAEGVVERQGGAGLEHVKARKTSAALMFNNPRLQIELF